MEKRTKVRGINYMKSHFKKVSFNQFKQLYGEKSPYKEMKQPDRDQALFEDWQELGGTDEVKPIKRTDKSIE